MYYVKATLASDYEIKIPLHDVDIGLSCDGCGKELDWEASEIADVISECSRAHTFCKTCVEAGIYDAWKSERNA